MSNENPISKLSAEASYRIAKETVRRIEECGLRDIQVPRAIELLAAGACLVTWKAPCGKVFFGSVKPRKS